MLTCIAIFSYNKYLKLIWLVTKGVTEVDDMKSLAKFLHGAFSLVFIGIFHLFGLVGSFKALLRFSE